MEQEIKSANYLEIYSELREKNNLEDSLYLFAEIIKNQYTTHSKDVEPEPISDGWISVEDKPEENKFYQVCVVRVVDGVRRVVDGYWNGEEFTDDKKQRRKASVENKYWRITHYREIVFPQITSK